MVCPCVARSAGPKASRRSRGWSRRAVRVPARSRPMLAAMAQQDRAPPCGPPRQRPWPRRRPAEQPRAPPPPASIPATRIGSVQHGEREERRARRRRRVARGREHARRRRPRPCRRGIEATPARHGRPPQQAGDAIDGAPAPARCGPARRRPRPWRRRGAPPRAGGRRRPFAAHSSRRRCRCRRGGGRCPGGAPPATRKESRRGGTRRTGRPRYASGSVDGRIDRQRLTRADPASTAPTVHWSPCRRPRPARRVPLDAVPASPAVSARRTMSSADWLAKNFTCARPPGNGNVRTRVAAPRAATAIGNRPDRLGLRPARGARDAGDRRRRPPRPPRVATPSAMATATGSLTAPCSAISSAGRRRASDDLRGVAVGDDAQLDVGGAAGHVGQARRRRARRCTTRRARCASRATRAARPTTSSRRWPDVLKTRSPSACSTSATARVQQAARLPRPARARPGAARSAPAPRESSRSIGSGLCRQRS